MAFVPPTISGYNINAPSDDGAVTPSNRGSWATIKAKLADPLYNWTDDLIDAIQALETELNAADAANAALVTALEAEQFVTGDVKPTLRTTANTGWVMMNDGTIGSATSGATTRANADCADLYTILWAIDDAWCPVTGGRGANAAADFAANKPIKLARMLGRALAFAGTGSGLSARVLGSYVGAETHTLSAAEMEHNHPISTIGGLNFGSDSAIRNTVTGAVQNVTAIAHNNMQPTAFLNVMIKL